MKIIHVVNGREVDITELVTSIEWSGDAKQVARVLSFGIVASSTDKNIPVLNLKLGDMVKMMNGNSEVYRGYIFTRDKSLSGNEIDITSYDGLIYLLKSKGTYNFKNTMPGSIVRRVASDFNIPTGSIINGTSIRRIFEGESIYNIIMTAYTLESNRTKKQYIPLMDKGKLNIIEKGKKVARYELDPSTSIIDAKYSESMESSINVVKVYAENGKYKGEVKLNGIPGRLQDVYKGDGGNAEARSLLKGIENTASLEAIGDWDCVTGNAVRVKDRHTGLVGLFYIDNDTHTFENGNHMMSLGLSFKNLMDKQEAGDDPVELAKKEASQTSGTSSSRTSVNNSGGASRTSRLISAAESMIGFKYSQSNRMGKSSADCSSLVGRSMKMAGLTNNAQLTTRSILNDSRFTRISKSQLRAGDIVWERGHMALFVGNGRLIEASSSRGRVRRSSLGNRFTYGYRIKGL